VTAYTATVEVDRQLTDTEAATLLEELHGLSPVVRTTDYNTHAVTVTLAGSDSEHDILSALVGEAVDAIHDAIPADVWAVTAWIVPADEFHQRSEFAEMRMLSVPAAAEQLGVSEQRIRQLLSAGKLIGTKVGRDWLVSAASVRHRKATR
jgi:excisionase family DNA binding protein